MQQMHKQRLHEETIGVKVPGRGHQLATVRVSATDSDEDVLRGISKVVGTIFNVTGVRYELVCAEPFKLKRLNGSKKRDLTVDDPPEEEEIVEVVAPEPPVVKAVIEVPPLPKDLPVVFKAPSKVVPEKTVGFQVGETWRTKDKRRQTTFKVVSIDGDFAVTDDARRIQLTRSCRYERI